MVEVRGYAAVVILFCSGIYEPTNSKELPHVTFFTQTTEVRFYQHRRYKWTDGVLEKFCGDLNMEVLTAYNVPTYNVIKDYILKQDKFAKVGFWYSLNDRKTEGHWYTADGEVMKYFTWKEGQPNGGVGEACTVLIISGHIWLYDTVCANVEYYAACSRKLGKPTIDYFEIQDCSNSLNLRWIANEMSVGLKHRINLVSLDDTHALLVDEKVVEAGPRTATIEGLQNGKTYIIEVTVCTDYCCCGVLSATTTMSKPFVGLPPPPKSPLSSKNGEICELTWSLPPYVKPSDVTEYKITMASSSIDKLDLSEDGLDNQDIATVDSGLKYTFKPKPNREYVVFIQTRTCNGYGEKVRFDGHCKANPIGALYVPSPALAFFPDNEISLEIALPEKSATKLICVFVLLQPRLANERMESSTIETITFEALKNASGRSPSTEGPYLAIAMPRPKSAKPFVRVELGNDITTECEVNYSMMKGQNWKLKYEWSYSIYVVLSNLIDKTFVHSRSASVELSLSVLDRELVEIPTEHEDCTSVPIVLPVVLALMDLVVGVAIRNFVINSKASADEDEEEGEENSEGDHKEKTMRKTHNTHKDNDYEGDKIMEASKEREHRHHHRHHSRHGHDIV